MYIYLFIKQLIYKYLIDDLGAIESFHKFFRRSNREILLLETILNHNSSMGHTRSKNNLKNDNINKLHIYIYIYKKNINERNNHLVQMITITLHAQQ